MEVLARKKHSTLAWEGWRLFKKLMIVCVPVLGWTAATRFATEDTDAISAFRGAESCGNKSAIIVVLAALLLVAAPAALGNPARGTDSTGMSAAPHTPRNDGAVIQIGRLVETFAGLETVTDQYRLAKIVENGQAKLRIMKGVNEVCTIPQNSMDCDGQTNTRGRVSIGGTSSSTRHSYSLAVDGLNIRRTASTCFCARSVPGYPIFGCQQTSCNTRTTESKIPWQ